MIRNHRRDYIEQLMNQGYGSTPGDVINYLVDRELDDLLRAKVLVPLSTDKASGKAEGV